MKSDPSGLIDGGTLTVWEAALILMGEAVGISATVTTAVLLTPLAFSGDSSPTQKVHTPPFKSAEAAKEYSESQDLDNSKPMEASNLANNPQKLSKTKGSKTSSNSPKLDGGNKDIWNRFKETLKQKLGDGYDKYMKENPDLRRELHDFQKPYKVGQNVPKKDIPKLINQFIKQLEG
jgi:hypothetical protein